MGRLETTNLENAAQNSAENQRRIFVRLAFYRRGDLFLAGLKHWWQMNSMEMNAPKIDPSKVLINLVLRGEPMAWKRAARRGGRTFDDPENIKAKEFLVERFEMAYPRFRPIEKRDLGVQLFFQTIFDSKDKDNMEKLVNDAFNGVIWADDRRIKEGYQRVRVWPSGPFTQVVVYLLGGGR